MEQRTAAISARVRPALKAKVTAAAAKDGRTVAQWVERVLEQAVADVPKRGAGKGASKT